MATTLKTKKQKLLKVIKENSTYSSIDIDFLNDREKVELLFGEWMITSYHEVDTPDNCCCGSKLQKYYMIKNIITQKELKVGIDCSKYVASLSTVFEKLFLENSKRMSTERNLRNIIWNIGNLDIEYRFYNLYKVDALYNKIINPFGNKKFYLFEISKPYIKCILDIKNEYNLQYEIFEYNGKYYIRFLKGDEDKRFKMNTMYYLEFVIKDGKLEINRTKKLHEVKKIMFLDLEN